MTTQSNPNVLFFVVAHIVNIPLRIKSLHQYVLEGRRGGGGGETLTPENYKSLLATRISVRVEMTSSS